MVLSDLSEVFRGYDKDYPFAGDPVWWKEFHSIQVERIRDPVSRERRNVVMILIETIYYFALLVSFIPLSLSFSDPPGSSDIRTFHEGLWNISDYEFSSSSDFWSWCETGLISSLYEAGQSGDPVAGLTGTSVIEFSQNPFSVPTTPPVLAGTDMILMGPVRLRQLRVNEGDCSDEFAYRSISTFCSPQYESRSNENRDTFFPVGTPSYLEDAFRYNTGGNGVLTSDVTLIEYSSGGFIADLPSKQNQGAMMISDLKDSNWIDYLTAAVIIEITVYHASLNTFALDRVVFEFPQDGTMHASQQIESFQAFEVSFVGANASQMTLNVVNIIWQVVGIGSMVFAIWTLRGRFFFFFWNWYDLAMLGVAFVYMGHRISMLILSPSDSFGFPSLYVPLSSIIAIKEGAIELQALMLFLLFARGLKLTLLVQWKLVRVLESTFSSFLGLVIMALLIYTGFSIAFHLTMGFQDVVFSNLSWAFTARALSLTNVVWTSGTSGMSALLNLGFILGFYFLVVPIMIATGIWGWLDINMGGPTDPKRKHPFSVLFELISNRLRRRSPVEAFDLLEREISLSQFPTIIADRIVRRRKAVCSRVVDVFGLFPSDYSEHRDTIHLTELQRILDDDSFTVKVLGSSDANQIAETLSAPDALVELQAGINRKIDVLQKTQLNLSFKFDPSIERLSLELRDVLRRIEREAQGDVAVLKEVIRNIDNVIEALLSKARRLRRPR